MFEREREREKGKQTTDHNIDFFEKKLTKTNLNAFLPTEKKNSQCKTMLCNILRDLLSSLYFGHFGCSSIPKKKVVSVYESFSNLKKQGKFLHQKAESQFAIGV